jgi:hypothetical protein
MEKTLWHPAFCGAMRLELDEYRDVLEFHDEHQLTSGSLRMDVLIIKKFKDIFIDKNIARIFKNYNILEYKSPDDSLTIYDYRKAHIYKLLYSIQHAIIDIEDISVTMVTSQHPYKVLDYLSNHYNVTSNQKGIYVVQHEVGLAQIVVSNELTEDQNIWLTHLNKELTAARLHRLLTVAAKHGKDPALETYLEVVAGANFQTLQETLMGKVIDQCLQDLGFTDKWRIEGEAEGILKGIIQGRAEGKTEGIIEDRAKMIIRILSHRLELPSTSLQNRISSIRNIDKLDELADFALTCISLDEFATALE